MVAAVYIDIAALHNLLRLYIGLEF